MADVHDGWVKGLRANGVQVASFKMNDRLSFFSNAQITRKGLLQPAFDEHESVIAAAEGIKAVCWDWRPDVLMVFSGFFVPHSILEAVRTKGVTTVLMATECPYEDDTQLQKAPWYGHVVVNDPTNIDQYLKANRQTVYIPHAYDPDLHQPGKADPDLACDFAFVGTGYPSRRVFFEQVDWSGLDVKFAGHWADIRHSPLLPFLQHSMDECCPNGEAVRLYQSAKLSANLYRREANKRELADGWAMGPREVELAACGTFFLRDPRGEGDELFPMLPTFTSPAELGDLARWWAVHDMERVEAAAMAREAVADRTFQNHARLLLERLSA